MVATTVNFDTRLDEMDAGCSESRRDRHHIIKERLKVGLTQTLRSKGST